jgi:hypothetical protein
MNSIVLFEKASALHQTKIHSSKLRVQMYSKNPQTDNTTQKNWRKNALAEMETISPPTADT